MKVSIIIPSYNQANFIERTILSVLNQSYKDIEIILIDGCSNDGTLEVINKYYDRIAKVVVEKDNGQSDALVKGFNLATGDIFGWLNSDDTYEPNAVAIAVEFMLTRSSSFVYGNRSIIDSLDNVVYKARQPKYNLFLNKFRHIIIPQMAAFWSRDLYQRSGGIDVSFQFAMDYDLFLRMSTIERPTYIPVYLGNFRIHELSKTSLIDDVRQKEDKRIFDRYYKRLNVKWPFFLLGLATNVVLIYCLLISGGLYDRIVKRSKWRI
jgi:glycosyltransferase involved in cell wall biosynthesis